MSSAEDVLDMKDICAELADRVVGEGAKLTARAGVVIRTLGGETTENRALELLKGKARRVDAWEKERAERRRDELRRLEAINHIGNLNRTLAYLKTTDPDGYRTHIDSVERSLAMAGVLDRPLAQTNTEGD